MKKFILGLLAITAIGITSCSKKYDCTCYDDMTGNVISTSTVSARNAAAASIECSGKTNSTMTCYLN